MKTRYTAFAVSLGLLVAFSAAHGQAPDGKNDVAIATTRLQQQYLTSFPQHPQLLNGPEYVNYTLRYHAHTGHQFFLVSEKQAGSVHYNKHDFGHVYLLYDLVLDQLVLSDISSPLMLSLIHERVREFTIGNHRFIRLVADSTLGKVVRPGYYETLLSDGGAKPVQVLAKRVKSLQEHVTQQHVDVEFITTDRFYLYKAGRYYPVSSKSSVLGPLADHGKELQQFVQAHQLRFKKATREASVVQLVTYYNTLAAH
jgi:hypothetical protein